MPWGKLDDRFHSHPKVEAAGNAAVGAYCRALSFCAAYHTNGFVSAAQARKFGSPKELERLCVSGLWTAVKHGETVTVSGRRDSGRRALPDVVVVAPEDGFFIPDFLHFHPTREESERHRNGGQTEH